MKNKQNRLPSQFQIYDKVSVDFKNLGFFIEEAIIIRIHFTEGKVTYDLSVQLKNNNIIGATTRLYNVDSLILSPYNGPATRFAANTSDGALIKTG